MGLTLPADRFGFKDAHKGETVWVLGSGRSMEHIPREFWRGKTCVTVNYVGMHLGLDEFYTVSHYHLDAVRVATWRPDLPVVTPVTDQGGVNVLGRPLVEPNVYTFPTADQQYAEFDAVRDWPSDPDALVVGPTSLHMTMHFAAYLGAAHIVLAGADCGVLDGASNLDGYPVNSNPYDVWMATLPAVADQLRKRGTSVHSLNPFVNLGLEGHSFHSSVVDINP